MRYNTPLESDGIFPRVTSGVASVEQLIMPDSPGRVLFQGTSWFARLMDTSYQLPVSPGQSVYVIERRGLVLLVEPLSRT